MSMTDKAARNTTRSLALDKPGLTRRRAVALGVVSAVALGASVPMDTALAQDATRERAAMAQRTLDRIVAQFANLDVISFAAEVRAQFHQASSPRIAAGAPIEGSFEYEADGLKWRKASYLDPELYPGINTEIAYDGQWYQYYMRNSDMMSVSVGADERLTGMCLPNPIFLLGQFLVPLDDSPQDVLLRHVRAAAADWTDSSVEWSSAGTPESPAMRAVLPGASYEGEPYDVHLTLPTDDDTAPIVMEMVREDGALLMRSTFSAFKFLQDDEAPGRWPTHVRFEVFDGAVDPMAEMVMHLHNLRVGGQPSDASRYRLDWNAPSRVWFDEGRTFLR